jgi:hypothetical protein
LNYSDALRRRRLTAASPPRAGGWGSIFWRKTQKIGNRRKKEGVAQLLYANPGGFERLLAFELFKGLEELEWGKLTSLLQPIKSRLHGGLREIEYRLGAICFVEHERGKGKKKRAAQETAASEFGVDIETIRTWENRLPEELGGLEVTRQQQFAYNMGTHVRADPEYRALVNYGFENLQSGDEERTLFEAR